MAKPIYMTDEIIQRMQEEFVEQLRKSRMLDGSVKYEKKFVYPAGEDVDKVHIIFTEMAYTKMQMLISEFSSEVAWHGVVERENDTTFIITDILVYPQEVTGATVNTDQEAYQQWMLGLDDETYNKLHAQMHSHVNMGCTPSSVDLTHQESIIAQLEDDDYYIFMIWNKRLEKTVKVYDMPNNMLYEGDDVVIEVREEQNGLRKFISSVKEIVKPKAWTGSSYNTNAGKKNDGKTSKSEKKNAKDNVGKGAASQQTTLPGYANGSGYGGSYGGSGYNSGKSYRNSEWYQDIVGPGDDLID